MSRPPPRNAYGGVEAQRSASRWALDGRRGRDGQGRAGMAGELESLGRAGLQCTQLGMPISGQRWPDPGRAGLSLCLSGRCVPLLRCCLCGQGKYKHCFCAINSH